jgi:hypothetical protein
LHEGIDIYVQWIGCRLDAARSYRWIRNWLPYRLDGEVLAKLAEG